MKKLFLIAVMTCLFTCKEENTQTGTPEIAIEKAADSVTPFASEIFSRFNNVRDLSMNTNGDEAYFTLLSLNRELSVIMKIVREGNTWQGPEIASFSGQYTDLEPFLSPDGKELYFASNRPVSKDSTNTKDFDIWFVKRDSMNAAWSEPMNLGAPVNTEANEFYPAITNSKNIYFTAITPETGPQDDIFVSEWQDGAYGKPRQLSDAVNTEGAEYNAYVSPDETMIIFGGWRRDDGLGSGDMYLSKKVDGNWQAATNLGQKINTKYMEFCPFVDVENKVLYFTSRRSGVKYGDSGFLNATDLIEEIERYDNGSSRIYQIDFSDHMR